MKRILIAVLMVLTLSITAFAAPTIDNKYLSHHENGIDYQLGFKTSNFSGEINSYLRNWKTSDRKLLLTNSNYFYFIDVPIGFTLKVLKGSASDYGVKLMPSKNFKIVAVRTNDSHKDGDLFLSAIEIDLNTTYGLSFFSNSDYSQPYPIDSTSFLNYDYFSNYTNEYTLPSGIDLSIFVPSPLNGGGSGIHLYCDSDVFGPLYTDPTPDPTPEPTSPPVIDFPVVKPVDNPLIPYDVTKWNDFVSYLKTVVTAVVNVSFKIFAFICGLLLITKIVNMFVK